MKDKNKFFMNSKDVKNILGKDFIMTEEIQKQINDFFAIFDDGDRSGIWRKNIAKWINRGLDDWVNRRNKLRNCSSNSKEWFELMYGDTWETHYTNLKTRASNNLSNRIEYWTARGQTIDEAKLSVKNIQTTRAKKVSKVLKGNSLHTVRSTKFWIKKGYSVQEAQEIVSKLQKRDIDFYICKYGVENGRKRYEMACQKRKDTWNSKDRCEHGKKTRPKLFNPNGQEMQAINGFIAANNIPVLHCMYGSPSEQFCQYIPEVGYRRYDLAVFEDDTHKTLKYILEFHGPGHINFSDYRDELYNEHISINGKSLMHLGTYGKSYMNDKVKRNHIINNYPNVKYCVMWVDDLINKRFKIDEL